MAHEHVTRDIAHAVPRLGHELAMEEISTAGAQKLLADTRVTMLLASEARRRALTRVYGVPREDQSRMVTLVLCASALTVAAEGLAKLVPHPKTGDIEICATLLFLGARGMAGIPAGTVPLAGAAIVAAVASRRGRDLLHELRIAARELDAAFRERYGHLISLQRRNSAPAATA